jgi:hypothetical protein
VRLLYAPLLAFGGYARAADNAVFFQLCVPVAGIPHDNAVLQCLFASEYGACFVFIEDLLKYRFTLFIGTDGKIMRKNGIEFRGLAIKSARV